VRRRGAARDLVGVVSCTPLQAASSSPSRAAVAACASASIARYWSINLMPKGVKAAPPPWLPPAWAAITAKPAPAKAGGGGSNGSRVRLWKRELQKLANQLGLDIVVNHLPPGTSKWNKIEHRLFSFISQNWRPKPLVSYRVIPGSSPRTELISATTTKTGLTVRCELDTGQYPQRHCRFRRRDGRHQHQTRRVPRRVELHHLTKSSSPSHAFVS